METFSALLALCAGIHRSPVNSPHKGQWHGALMFSLICALIHVWANNREAGDLRRHRAHYDVTVIFDLYGKQAWDNITFIIQMLCKTTHCDIMTPYCVIEFYSTLVKVMAWRLVVQAITWTNTDILSIGLLVAKSSEIWIKNHCKTTLSLLTHFEQYFPRDLPVYASSQWETALQCNAVSHWLDAYTKWPLLHQHFIPLPRRNVSLNVCGAIWSLTTTPMKAFLFITGL